MHQPWQRWRRAGLVVLCCCAMVGPSARLAGAGGDAGEQQEGEGKIRTPTDDEDDGGHAP